MESALPAAPLNSRPQPRTARRGRLGAALLLFAALAGCGRGQAPVVAATWRVGLGAASLATDGDARLLAVACARSNDVWVLDLADGALRHRIDTLPRPRTVLFHPERAAFFVAEGLSSVAQVRLEDERVARRFRPRSRVSRLIFEPVTGRLFAAHQASPTLGVYRLRDMHLETSLAVGGEIVDLDFDGREAWLATRQADALVRLTLADLSVKAAVLAGPDPRDLDLRPDQDRALLACHGRRGEAAPLALPTPVPSPDALALLGQPGQAAVESAETEGGGEGPGSDGETETEDGPEPPLSSAWDGGGLAVFRLSDVRRLDYLELPGGPVAALADASARRAAVACSDGKLRIVDLRKRRVTGELALGGRPSALLRHPDGVHLLVALGNKKSLLLVHPGPGW